MVSVYVSDVYFEAEALALADKHCAQYGLTAKLRKPRNAGRWGDIYDYNCVK